MAIEDAIKMTRMKSQLKEAQSWAAVSDHQAFAAVHRVKEILCASAS